MTESGEQQSVCFQKKKIQETLDKNKFSAGLLIFARTGVKTGLAAGYVKLKHQNLLVKFLRPARKN